MSIFNVIDKLLIHAQNHLGLQQSDVHYVRNNVLTILGLDSYQPSGETVCEQDIDSLLADLVQEGAKMGLFEAEYGAAYCDRVMGELSLRPSQLDQAFACVYQQQGPKAATEWLYDYCVANGYVKKAVLDKNPRFFADGLVVTINLAKPEFRDPKKAASGNSVAGGYPQCVICRENEGFSKRGKCTLRTVSLNLDGKPWFWQFSPYGYFFQHGIVVNCEHIPMHVDRQTFVNLFDFVDQFPHYFVGCNAPLERIGGSVLAHDHYQGGGEKLPLHSATVKHHYVKEGYEDVTIGTLDWPGTVIRLSSFNKDKLVELSSLIHDTWYTYQNQQLGLIPTQNGKQCHEISPTVVKRNGCYEMNIILRSNITSERYPDGVFHAHPEFHIIKKESIGLIEAQGLFILPGRLVSQLAQVEELIVNQQPLTAELAEFKDVYDETKALVTAYDKDSVHLAMQKELSSICYRILQNTAVFKSDSDLDSFLQGMGFVQASYQYKISASGRVNVIGEHIDYCGGKVFPAALSLKNTVYARANGTNSINISWTTLPNKVTLDLNKLDSYRDLKHACYQAGCAYVWQQAGYPLVGCDLHYDCAVPFGGGLSSSAAIEVSTLQALATLTNTTIDKRTLALLAQKAEREYCGINCGIMDQYASANGSKNHAMVLDCKAVSHQDVPLDLQQYTLVIANCNKPHSLVTSKYNERRQETDKALEILQQVLPVSCLAEVTVEQFEQYKHLLPEVIANRCKHVVYECQRVADAEQALKQGDLVKLGQLLNQSHASLRDLYEVTGNELDVLAHTAQNHPACLGSRMTGAGFGGCTVSIVNKEDVESFKTLVGNTYKKAVGYSATFYDVEISDGITIEKLL